MKLAVISCVVFTVISVLTGTAEAAVGWTTPSGITGPSGSAIKDVAEDTAAGGTIMTLAATGAGTVTFSIVSQPTDAKLEITTATLKLLSGKSFDYETETTYVVKIKAVDPGDSTATGTGTVTLTLNITNVMDVAPTFQSGQYAVTIPDGASAGQTLIQVPATDPETSYGDTITYSITGGNTGTVFEFVGNTIKVAATKSTNTTSVGGYTLAIKAADSKLSTPNSATATVWVAVMTCSSGSSMMVASGISAVFAFVLSFL